MRKILSVLLSLVILVGSVSTVSVAAGDTCIKLSDTSGATGYSAGSDDINEWIKENEGGTLIFDVKLESVATPGEGQTSRLVAFTGDDPYNFAGYDFTNGKFTAGAGTAWPTAQHSTTYTPYSERAFEWESGRWYELALQYDGCVATVYLDGIPMVSAEVDGRFETDYIIMYPQYCTVLIDNLRMCGKDYNVRDRYGDIFSATGFDGVTTTDAVSCWYFGSEGYSVSDEGRPMPELGEMLPDRTVAPSIDGAYLKYVEAGGNGIAASTINFSTYNGFTYVEDVRVDRKSVAATFGVRFGNYIAGYDWDNSCFRIATRSGYGFNTSSAYSYAKTDHALSLGTVYEFAVRLDGNTVSVYLNGVLMAQASNDAFAQSCSYIEVSHYRMGASIDNVVVAYPDYDVREAKGSAAGRFTFDEHVSYIDGIMDYNLDTASAGYSVTKATDGASVTVSDAEAAEGTATVGITLDNCTDYTAFEMEILYPTALTVKQTSVLALLKGTSVVSPAGSNPVTIAYAAPANGTVSDGRVVDVVFNTPDAYGDYVVSVTVRPYIGDIPGAAFSSTGTVTVPGPSLPVGSPAGFTYDGEIFTWDEVEGAGAYELYMMYEDDDYEYPIDVAYSGEYSFEADSWIPDPGVYIFKVYLYDEDYTIVSVSHDLTVIRTDDGTVYCSLGEYAATYYAKLAAFAEGPYSAANQSKIDSLLAEAETAFAEAANVSSLETIYETYAAQISDIPVSSGAITGDVDGDGAVSNLDYSLLSRFLRGGAVTCEGEPDVDGNGSINNLDLAMLKKMLK
ncbi:MAG: hypothetical protein IJ386_00270 [Clostridia bacterium]|nr:hypothetical protein [Clostridia bacterium]